MEGISGLVGMDSVLNIANLAKILGKTEEDLVLPGGRKVKTIAWKGEDLDKIHDLIHNQSGNLPALVKVNGAMPAWLVTALVHECHPMSVALNTPEGNFSPAQLEKVVPPEVPFGARVIISGRGPLYLAASVAMAYHGTAKAIACLQPGVGATVCITHTVDTELGLVVPV